MSETTHTKGPWMWTDEKGGSLVPAKPYNAYLAAVEAAQASGDYGDVHYVPEIIQTDSGVYGPYGADRSLIAAAPELYAAVKSVLDWFAAIDAEQWERTGPTQTLESASRNWELPSEVPSLDMVPLQAAVAKAEGR